jgi:hypothetical protein
MLIYDFFLICVLLGLIRQLIYLDIGLCKLVINDFHKWKIIINPFIFIISSFIGALSTFILNFLCTYEFF